MSAPTPPVTQAPSPEIRLDAVPDLWSYGLRPYVITGFLVQVLRQHFADRGNVEEPSLRASLWVADNPSGIVIETSTRWKPAEAGVRPAVIIKENDCTVQRLGIDDVEMGYGVGATGVDYYETLWGGSHTLFCVANEMQTKRLASEVARLMIHGGKEFRDYLLLKRFVFTQLGAVAKLEESSDNYVVPVTVAWWYSDLWRSVPQAPNLKNISLSSVLEGGV